MLAVKTVVDKKKNGNKGSAHYFVKIYATLLISMILVAVVFWVAIAPSVAGSSEIMTYGNFATHLVNPLILLADYIFFSESGRLKKHDPYWILIYPAVYVVKTGILGALGVRYDTPFSDGVYWAPYPFLDWSRFGALTALMILGFALVILGLGYLLLFIDRKLARKSQKKEENKNENIIENQ
ncbi:MAG: Pr6Pr family membrane protein [Firmicutes bacterium]|nr:Pr6Pr family membrane protein [Bacillota bacterium]